VAQGFGVRHARLDQIAVFASYMVYLEYLRDFREGLTDSPGADPLLGPNQYERGQAQAYGGGIDLRGVALNDTPLFQLANPIEYGGGRHIEAAGDIGVAGAGVGLQQLQDGEIGGIEHGSSDQRLFGERQNLPNNHRHASDTGDHHAPLIPSLTRDRYFAVMSHGALPPESPRASTSAAGLRRTGLTTSLAALESAVHALALPGEAEDAADSIRRIARALIEGGALEGRIEPGAAASEVLAADRAGIGVAARRLVELLALETRASKGDDLVLVIEDDVVFARTLEFRLATTGARMTSVATAAAARDVLKGEAVSLVVLDLILPDSDGRNILLELRSDPRTAGLPVFVVSARLGTHTKAECFALGADAYFEKPLDLDAFAVAVGSRLERHHEQAELARRDPVTCLPNRAAFLESCHRLRQAGLETRFSLAVLDLDHFRWVEETWGRQVGDDVLRRAGSHIATALAQAALFARWDGAEFIALFAGPSASEAGVAVDGALGVLRQVDLHQGEGDPLVVTFSAGVVDVPAGQTLEDTIAVADRLCYVAKSSGRNRVVAGEPAGAIPSRRILLAEDDPDIVRMIRRHLEHEGFEVVAYADGAKALANAAGSGAALIISDIEMPNLDGLGLLQGLRARPEFRHIPIMMLTAMGDESYVVRAFELGADDYVLKPFSMREVTARVRRLLRRPSIAGVPAGG
jgi:two-component system, cell cycle response regulator